MIVSFTQAKIEMNNILELKYVIEINQIRRDNYFEFGGEFIYSVVGAQFDLFHGLEN